MHTHFIVVSTEQVATQAIARALQNVELAIMATPSGDARNNLCDAQLLMMAVQQGVPFMREEEAERG